MRYDTSTHIFQKKKRTDTVLMGKVIVGFEDTGWTNVVSYETECCVCT